MHDKATTTSLEQLRLLHALKIGTTRADIYGELRKLGMIAYNNLYNPGKPFGANGCDYESTRAQAYWPALNEQLPPDGCPGPASNRLRADFQKVPKSPSAFVDVGTNYNFACGTSVSVRLDFNDDDSLTKIDEAPAQQACM